MNKKDKKVELTDRKQELVEEKSVTSIVSEDKNKIEEATTKAKKNIDSVAYKDNLVPPSKKSKSIRTLKIEEKKEEKSKDETVEKNDETKNENTYPIEKQDTAKNKKEAKSKQKKTKDSIEEPIKEEAERTVAEQTKEITKKVGNVLEEEKKWEQPKDTSKKTYKTAIILSLTLVIIIVLFLLFSTVFALISGYKSTIINGVKIKDIDVSGLNREEAIAKVSTAFEEKLEKQITLKHNDYSITVFPDQFDVSFAIEEAVDMAYKKGRTRKYFSK